MIERVRKTIQEFHMLEPGDGVVVGVSGGADSMCLLQVLTELAEEFALKLHVVHVNHLLRTEADIEENYVQEFCKQMNIPCTVFRKNIDAYAEETGASIEEAGRNFRYECFEQVCRQEGMKKIAVAHHQNDRAETLIFHMIRGTGMRGLGSIPPMRGRIIRPLWNVAREDIEAYLKKKKILYYTDASNLSDDYSRNVIRNQILPRMEAINEKAVSHLAEVSTLAKEYWEFVEQMAVQSEKAAVVDCENGVLVGKDRISELPVLVQRHIIYRLLVHLSGSSRDWEQKHVEQVLDLVERPVGKQVSLPYHLQAIRSYEGIRIGAQVEPQQSAILPIAVEPNTRIKIAEIGWLDCICIDWTVGGEISKNLYTKMFDYDKIKGNLCVRNPMPGDYLVINSKGEQKKLSRYFIDNKVPREQREHMLVLAFGQQICWVIGMRMSEEFKVTEETNKVLKITFWYEGE